MLDRERLLEALETLSGTLADRGYEFHVAVAGAGALLLTGDLDHPTRDVDVVAVASGESPLRSQHQLPDALTEAAKDVATIMGIDHDWLNSGALGVLFGRLPDGYEDRLRTMRFGNLTVSALGRKDLIRLKLWAAAEEGPNSTHHVDLSRMGLDRAELDDAEAWVNALSPGGPYPGFDDVLESLRRLLR